MDNEHLEQQVINARTEINDIKEKVGLLFLFVLCAIIFFSVLGLCNVFEKRTK